MFFKDPSCFDIILIRYEFVEEDMTNQTIGMVSGRKDIIEISGEDPNSQGTFSVLLFTVENKFKEIRQVRAYGIQSLIGNAGGYLGLFLGKII